MKIDNHTFRVSNAGTPTMVAGAIGLLGLAASAFGFLKGFTGSDQALGDQFAHSYLVSLMFFVSISLGCLFFVLVGHLVNMRWGIVLRRIAEAAAISLPILLLLFLPLLILLVSGKMSHESGLWPWSDAAWMQANNFAPSKMWWLNPKFFALRTIIYFGIWTVLAGLLWINSRKQDVDGHDDKLYMKFRLTSGPGMVIYALSLTLASFDWLMSIQPKWYSTMFGVYLFAMSILAMWCFLSLAVTYIRSQGALRSEITINHYHDLGKGMFAFTVFWAYIAFCQYLLIWYANIPEEVEFYLERWSDPSWQKVSLFIIVGHFVIPFLALLSRIPKRNVVGVCIMAVWILFMHWVELHWLIVSHLNHSVHLHWLDATTFIGVGGIFVSFFWWRLTSAPMLPVKDPFLQKSIDFVNV